VSALRQKRMFRKTTAFTWIWPLSISADLPFVVFAVRRFGQHSGMPLKVRRSFRQSCSDGRSTKVYTLVPVAWRNEFACGLQMEEIDRVALQRLCELDDMAVMGK
jgi:hypothetical protein